MSRRFAVVLAVALLAGVSGCGFGKRLADPGPVPKISGSAAVIASAPLPKRPVLSTSPGHYIGVFEANAPRTYKSISSFESATGFSPKIVLYYSDWKAQFQASFAEAAYAHGSMPLVELQPTNIPMSAIISGQYDAYLESYAESVRAFEHPVVLSFGHEMNGNWYSWGAGHTSPSAFVAAWKHIVQLFRQAGALNVVWLWTVNSIGNTTSSFKQWWPGDQWVDCVGIDGYYYWPTATFESVFANTFSELRTFTNKPVLIAETAVGPSDMQASQIRGLFAGIKHDRMVGMVWFDKGQHGGTYHQDWRLEDSPEAVAAFRQGLEAIR